MKPIHPCVLYVVHDACPPLHVVRQRQPKPTKGASKQARLASIQHTCQTTSEACGGIDCGIDCGRLSPGLVLSAWESRLPLPSIKGRHPPHILRLTSSHFPPIATCSLREWHAAEQVQLDDARNMSAILLCAVAEKYYQVHEPALSAVSQCAPVSVHAIAATCVRSACTAACGCEWHGCEWHEVVNGMRICVLRES